MSTVGAQDIRRRLPANGAQNVQATGTFVFYKAGAARVAVTINNETVTMEPGDVRRTVQPFDGFEVQNTTGIEQDVELVAGFGDYSRLVVRGEISSFTSVLGVDGLARPDSRQDIELTLGLTMPGEFTVDYYQPYKDYSTVLDVPNLHTLKGMVIGQSGDIIGSIQDDDYNNYLIKWDRYTGQEMIRKQDNFLTGLHHWSVVPETGVVHISRGGGFGDPEGYIWRINESTLELYDQRRIEDDRALMFPLRNGYWIGFKGENNSSSSLYDYTVYRYAFKEGNIVRRGDVKEEIGFTGNIDVYDEDLFVSHPTRDDWLGVVNKYGVTWLNFLTGQKTGESVSTSQSMLGSEIYRLRGQLFGRGGVDKHTMVYLSEIKGSYWGYGLGLTDDQVLIDRPNTVAIEKTDTAHYYDDHSKIWQADIIKIALNEWRRGNGLTPAPGDYLDYVHKLTIDGKTVVDTDYRSFKREDIQDVFTISSPARIGLTITEQLRT